MGLLRARFLLLVLGCIMKKKIGKPSMICRMGLRFRFTTSALKELHEHLKIYEIPKKTTITKIFGNWTQKLGD
jgi:hypothetical protein